MENIIYNELRARGYNVDVGQLSVREKTENKDKNNKPIYAAKNLEVDFIAALGDDKYYLQSTLNMEDEDKGRTKNVPSTALTILSGSLSSPEMV